ncbi:MAG TPA: Crp/Fnr family transcriptional regulator [Magnetospirillum sp.]|nr:Crp/Fnr family transcriptional regulator [Magnetospirillum sp.]
MTDDSHDLYKVELFEGLPPEAVAEIQTQCGWLHVAADQQVFDKESDTQDVYFVVSGVVRILTAGPDDREVALADIQAGNYFGELAAIDGMRRSARVVATTDAVLALLPPSAFLDLMRRHPEIAMRVLNRLSRVIRRLDSRVTELSIKSDKQRVFGQLLQLAEPDPADPERLLIADLPNHREIAAWTGTSREIVAQAIGELARQGIVRRRGIGLQIPHWRRLQEMTA